MSLWNMMKTAQVGMDLHRYRSEVAGQTIATAFTPGADGAAGQKLAGADFFNKTLRDAQRRGGKVSPSLMAAVSSAARVAASKRPGPGGGERQQALEGTIEMMNAKSAYEMNVRTASMAKGMMIASLEIGRGG